MRIDLITIFPDIFDSYINESIIRRARSKGVIDISVHNLRDYADDKHNTVDDTPYGGGAGMVLKVEPIHRAVRGVLNVQTVENDSDKQAQRYSKRSDTTTTTPTTSRTILLSAKGKRYTQRDAERLKEYDQLIFICGRYEGVDERVTEHIADEEISIGDYVLTGGELGALVIVDSVARLLPGVLGNVESLKEESFSMPLEALAQGQSAVSPDEIKDLEMRCEHPHYTKPEEYNKWRVPEILLSGDHGAIEKWRSKNAKNA